jgi:hypothetical protein
MKQNQQITSAIENGYSFRTGDYFNQGLEIFKKNPGGYIGYIIVFGVISMITGLIPILGNLIGLVINPPLAVGMAIAAHKQETEQNEDFGNFFKGFDHIVQLVIANILMLGIYFFISLPLIYNIGLPIIMSIISGNPEDAFELFSQIENFGLVFFFTILVSIFITISLRWTNYFIVFYKYDAIEALKTSWKMVNKNWFSHLGFGILAFLIMIGGLIALIIGIIFVIPIVVAADYAAFSDVTGLGSKEDAIDEIGNENEYLV